MAANFCSDCGTRLEQQASFCHNCGHQMVAGGPPPSAPVGAPMAPAMPPGMPPGMPPLGMMPPPGMEVPPTPITHHRAMGVLGGIVLIFSSCLVLVLALLFLIDLAWEYVYHDDGWESWEETVIQWEYVMAGVFMIASFSIGLASGIAAIRSTRFTLALTGAIMVMASTALVVALDDVLSWAFCPILGAVGLASILIARPGFKAPVKLDRPQTPPVQRDNYGKESAWP